MSTKTISFYVFVSSVPLSLDELLLTSGDDATKKIGAHPHLEVFLIQSKNSTSWSEAVWGHFSYR